MDYEKLLKKARKSIPKDISKKERFDMPKVKGHIQGNKTIISNFCQLCDIFCRDESHLLKYLQRELATPAILDGPRLILGRKISSNLINEKLDKYAKEFVICKECGKPDTKLINEDGVLFVKCTACGAKYSIKSKYDLCKKT